METLRENEYGCLKASFTFGNPVLHLHVNKWSHNIFKKEILPMWADVLRELKEKGYKGVYALVKEEEKKIIKFHYIMGMHTVLIENGFVLNGRAL